jgi:hypothetical protein
MWRGGVTFGIPGSGPFGCRSLTSRAMATFPHPAHQTVRAVFRQIWQLITPSLYPRNPVMSPDPYPVSHDDASSILQPEHSRSRSLISCESCPSHCCNSSNRSACERRSWSGRIWRRSSWSWCEILPFSSIFVQNERPRSKHFLTRYEDANAARLLRLDHSIPAYLEGKR